MWSCFCACPIAGQREAANIIKTMAQVALHKSGRQYCRANRSQGPAAVPHVNTHTNYALKINGEEIGFQTGYLGQLPDERLSDWF